GASRRKLIRCRESSSFSGKSPKMRVWTYRDIECSVGEFGILLRAFQNIEQRSADRHWLAPRLVAQAHQFAGGLVIATGLVQRRDLAKCSIRRFLGGSLIRAVQGDGEHRPHVRAVEGETLELWRWWSRTASHEHQARA